MQSTAPLVIVTGFTDFLNVTDNPSARLALELARTGLGPDVQGAFLTLDTSYHHVSEQLPKLLSKRPSALIHLGYSEQAPGLRLERRATNARSGEHPDAAGFIPSGYEQGTRTIDNEALNFPALQSTLARAEIPSDISHDCGNYVCNHTYFTALDLIRRGSLGTKALFVHVPMAADVNGTSADSMSILVMAQGIRLITRQLIESSIAALHGGGS